MTAQIVVKVYGSESALQATRWTAHEAALRGCELARSVTSRGPGPDRRDGHQRSRGQRDQPDAEFRPSPV
jgi:hypothetical protein